MPKPTCTSTLAYLAVLIGTTTLLAGCMRSDTASWSPRSEVGRLPEKAQRQIDEYLTEEVSD